MNAPRAKHLALISILVLPRIPVGPRRNRLSIRQQRLAPSALTLRQGSRLGSFFQSARRAVPPRISRSALRSSARAWPASVRPDVWRPSECTFEGCAPGSEPVPRANPCRLPRCDEPYPRRAPCHSRGWSCRMDRETDRPWSLPDREAPTERSLHIRGWLAGEGSIDPSRTLSVLQFRPSSYAVSIAHSGHIANRIMRL